MTRKLSYLLLSWLLWLLTFAAGKVGFMLYNHGGNPFAAGDVCAVLWHGLSMDMSTAGYLIALPWLVCLVACLRPSLLYASGRSYGGRSETAWGRRLLVGYLCIAAFLVALIVCGDCFLYDFWKFKINATIFSYMDDMQGTTNSVSVGFLITRILVVIVTAIVIAALQLAAIRVLDADFSGRDRRHRYRGEAYRHRYRHTASWPEAAGILVLAAPIFLAIRGGIGTGVQNVGTAYYSQNMFLNHSAVNPAFSLMSSIKRSDNFARQFRFYTDAECAEIVKGLYGDNDDAGGARSQKGKTEEEVADTLLRVAQPNILIVMMEGFGGRFVKDLGGMPDVAPCFNRLVGEGIFFDHYYSNSFRTDRGTVSLLSGHVSYPTTSLMRLPDRLGGVSGLAGSLAKVGYATHYLYGGDINFSGTSGYLVGTGYQHIVSDKDFPIADAKSSKWGVCDGLTAQRCAEMVSSFSTPAKGADGASQGRAGHFMTYQTLSSHEPFDVPYQRLKDEKLNAFAYTDECVGQLIATLKKSPAWDNLLVILVPDHGFLYDLTYDNPEFFHTPMLWLGGAIKHPRRISVLMNQSDLCATLLAQLRLPHDEYPWSRDVLSPSYRTPFVYSTSPDGVMLRDSTGVTVYSLSRREPILEQPSASPSRLRTLKALLQHTYSELDKMHGGTKGEGEKK